jgi:hypothetical protein
MVILLLFVCVLLDPAYKGENISVETFWWNILFHAGIDIHFWTNLSVSENYLPEVLLISNMHDQFQR